MIHMNGLNRLIEELGDPDMDTKQAQELGDHIFGAIKTFTDSSGTISHSTLVVSLMTVLACAIADDSREPDVMKRIVASHFPAIVDDWRAEIRGLTLLGDHPSLEQMQ